MHEGITGEIPTGRVSAAGVLFEDFGAAIITGGLLETGQVACDV